MIGKRMPGLLDDHVKTIDEWTQAVPGSRSPYRALATSRLRV